MVDSTIREARRKLNIDTRQGVLGNASGVVRAQEAGYYYVRVEKSAGVYFPAAPYPLMSGAIVDPQADIPVYIGYDPKTRRDVILGMNTLALSAVGINPLHANPNDPAASDLLYADKMSWLYCRPHTDQTKPFYAQIYPARLLSRDNVVSFSGAEIDLSSYLPDSGYHRYVMVFLKSDFATLEAFGSTQQLTGSALDDTDLTEAYIQRSQLSIAIRAFRIADTDSKLNGKFVDSPYMRQFVSEFAIHQVQTGDSWTGGKAGIVAAPGASDTQAGKFWAASGTWEIPSGASGAYTPAVAGNWHDPDPTTYAEGLDDLAVRTVHLEDYGSGWPPDCSGSVTLSFNDGTLTFTITPDSPITYYCDGVPFTLSAADSVVITDTEGLWYIYFVDDVLTASQTPWDIMNPWALVATLYWDATNNEAVHMSYELHSWVMDDSTHRNIHSTIGTRYASGLTASINGNELDLTGGVIFDEDIRVSIVDDDTPDTEWEQALTPLAAPKLYRDGASGDWRIDSATSTPVIIASNIPQYNWYTGGAWTLDDVGSSQYFAYWVIATTDPDNPVIMVPGQEVDNTLAQSRTGNSISDMQFGNLPTAEFKVIWRVICHRIAGSPYYAIDELNDYRNVLSEPTSGFTGTDHGSQGGLLDDDHTQYVLVDGSRVITGAPVFHARLTLETGVAVSTSDQTAKTEVFLTPYKGNKIDVYDGSQHSELTLGSDISILLTDDTQTGDTENGSAVIVNLTDTSQFIVGMVVSGSGIPVGAVIDSIDSATQITMDQNATATASGVSLTFKVAASTNLDIFVYPSSGSLKLGMVAWTNSTTRATALTLQDGVESLTGSTTWRYCGSVRVGSTAGQTERSVLHCYIWNAYNQEPFEMYRKESAANWSQSVLSTWRQANANSSNQLDVITGLATKPIMVTIVAALQQAGSAGWGEVAVGEDSTTTPVDAMQQYQGGGVATSGWYNFIAILKKVPTVGYHNYVWLERADDATVNWVGTGGAALYRASMALRIWS